VKPQAKINIAFALAPITRWLEAFQRLDNPFGSALHFAPTPGPFLSFKATSPTDLLHRQSNLNVNRYPNLSFQLLSTPQNHSLTSTQAFSFHPIPPTITNHYLPFQTD